jgi:hypothetical protein
MPLLETGRWPSIYDAESLRVAIRQIVDAGPEFDARFYELGDFLPKSGAACQGDVVHLVGPAPVIDTDGQAIVTDVEFEHWMIIGNTCDLDRGDTESTWSQIVPLAAIHREPDAESLSSRRAHGGRARHRSARSA